jgi:hypothetical protein
MAYQGDDQYLVWEDDQTHWNWDTVQTPTGGSSREFSAMGESLTEQYRVRDDGLWVVNLFFQGGKKWRVPEE